MGMHNIRAILAAMSADKLLLIYDRLAGGRWYLSTAVDGPAQISINRFTAGTMVLHKSVLLSEQVAGSGLSATHLIYKVNPS